MLKSPILAVILFLNLNAFAQKFESTLMGGITPYVVINFPNQTASELYQKTYNWTQEQYSTFNKRDLFQIQNQKIRSTIRVSDRKYITVQFTFKNQKIKFEVIRQFRVDFVCIDEQYFAKESEIPILGWDKVLDIHKISMSRKRYILILRETQNQLNVLKNNFYDYCTTNFNKRESNW